MSPRLLDLCVDIQREAASLGRGLHQDAVAELAALVRIMNSYYSNLIEGHHTRPRDIEAAMNRPEDVPVDERPKLQEAVAHVLVQGEIDHLAAAGQLPTPTTVRFLTWLHAEFYQRMPPEFIHLQRDDGTRIDVRPGQFRQRPEEDNSVGDHFPPSSERVQAFMAHFEKRYALQDGGAGRRLLAMPAAHHRFAYIHPFVDGNGRVGRLMSHAMASWAGVGSGGLWSISRGLARGLHDRTEYKRRLSHADSPRQGDLDGRGNLSLKALEEFSEWFLLVCLDQIRFCKAMFDFDNLETRYHRLVEDLQPQRRDSHAKRLITTVLRHGELARMDAALVTGASERTSRTVLGSLVELGILKSKSPRGPVRIGFPLDYRERLFPNLFTDAEIDVPPPPPFPG